MAKYFWMRLPVNTRIIDKLKINFELHKELKRPSSNGRIFPAEKVVRHVGCTGDNISCQVHLQYEARP